MAEIFVRVTAHVVDERGEVITQIASAASKSAGGNPAFFGSEFADLAMQELETVRKQIQNKHGTVRTHTPER